MQRKIQVKSEQDDLDCLQFDVKVRRCGVGIKSIELTCQLDDQIQVGQVIGKIVDEKDQVKDIAVRVPGWIFSVNAPPFRLTDPVISLCKIVKCKHEEFEESELKHMRLCLKCGEELWVYPNKSVGVVIAKNLNDFEASKKNIDYSRQHIEIMFSSFLKKNEIVLPGVTLFKGQIISNQDEDNEDEDEDNEEIKFSLKECVRLVEFNRNYKNDDSWILKYEKIICSHQRLDPMNLCEFCNAHVTNHSNLSYAGLSSENKTALIGADYAIRQKNLAVQQLSSNKKLILVLDLDNTILHAIQAVTSATFNPIAHDDVCEFYNQNFFKYVIRMRPYLKEFLQQVLPHFEIYIFTMAIFDYAKAICDHIRKVYADILQNYPSAFSVDRILSRQQIEKSNKNLSKILPDSDKIMLILDDRSDVWLKNSGNLLTTLPYIYWGEGEESWNGSAFKAVVKIITNANVYFEKLRAEKAAKRQANKGRKQIKKNKDTTDDSNSVSSKIEEAIAPMNSLPENQAIQMYESDPLVDDSLNDKKQNNDIIDEENQDQSNQAIEKLETQPEELEETQSLQENSQPFSDIDSNITSSEIEKSEQIVEETISQETSKAQQQQISDANISKDLEVNQVISDGIKSEQTPSETGADIKQPQNDQNLESNQPSLSVELEQPNNQSSSNQNTVFLQPTFFQGPKIQEQICKKYDNVEQYQKQQQFSYKLSIVKDVDNYLLFTGPLLAKLKDDFYGQEAESRDIRSIFSQYQKSILKGVKIAVTSILVKYITQETSIICQRFIQLGGQIVDSFNSADEIDYLLIGGSTRTHKVKNAQHLNIPIISFKWVHYCWFFNYKLDPSIFTVSSNLVLSKNNQQIEQEICKHYPSSAKLF